jgi:hypothetical protein
MFAMITAEIGTRKPGFLARFRRFAAANGLGMTSYLERDVNVMELVDAFLVGS